MVLLTSFRVCLQYCKTKVVFQLVTTERAIVLFQAKKKSRRKKMFMSTKQYWKMSRAAESGKIFVYLKSLSLLLPHCSTLNIVCGILNCRVNE